MDAVVVREGKNFKGRVIGARCSGPSARAIWKDFRKKRQGYRSSELPGAGGRIGPTRVRIVIVMSTDVAQWWAQCVRIALAN